MTIVLVKVQVATLFSQWKINPNVKSCEETKRTGPECTNVSTKTKALTTKELIKKRARLKSAQHKNA